MKLIIPNAFARRAALISMLLTSAVKVCAAIHYVTPMGSAAPERDDPSRPWQLVEAAARALPAEGGSISISPGVYREAFTLDAPVVFTAPSGGATIGALTAGVAVSTTFTVLTWNTHMFGDIVFLPSWADFS